MGTIHHDFVIFVTFGDYAEKAWEDVKEYARSKSEDDFLGVNFESLLVGPMPGTTNGFITYMMVPDGSKEWWETSEVCNDIREFLIKRMENEIGYLAYGSFGELTTRFTYDNEELLGEART